MVVTIHVPHPDRSTVVQQLVDLAGDPAQVWSCTAGFTVPDEVAVAYLTAVPTPAPDVVPAPPRTLSPGVAADVRGVEERLGLTEPRSDMPAPKSSTPRRGRRPTTASEE